MSGGQPVPQIWVTVLTQTACIYCPCRPATQEASENLKSKVSTPIFALQFFYAELYQYDIFYSGNWRRVAKFRDIGFTKTRVSWSIEKQEAQLMLTNPRDAFRGQSKSPNRYSFLLRNSNFVFKTRRFFVFDFKTCRDLEIRVRGHSRSLRMVPFDRLCMISY